jgi:ABC-type phosphate transport system permease subunit
MRALCGAIITAGALIGLGLWSIGAGQRYATYNAYDNEGNPQFVLLRNIDTALMVTLVALLCMAAIGLGIALLGLAYHHHRRHHELLHRQRQAAAPRTGGPGMPPSPHVTV